MFQGPFQHSVIKRAVDKGLVKIQILDVREYTHDSHHTADDYQYGGGPGMVMKPEPVFEATEAAVAGYTQEVIKDIPIILLSPQGRVFHQGVAEELARKPGMVLICGHYEGVDERIRKDLATDEISVGDYVLTGGELAAMVLVDAVARLIPGVVGSEESVLGDSITSGPCSTPYTPGPPCTATSKSLQFCCLVTMPRLRDGAGNRPFLRQCSGGPTCWGRLSLLKRTWSTCGLKVTGITRILPNEP